MSLRSNRHVWALGRASRGAGARPPLRSLGPERGVRQEAALCAAHENQLSGQGFPAEVFSACTWPPAPPAALPPGMSLSAVLARPQSTPPPPCHRHPLVSFAAGQVLSRPICLRPVLWLLAEACGGGGWRALPHALPLPSPSLGCLPPAPEARVASWRLLHPCPDMSPETRARPSRLPLGLALSLLLDPHPLIGIRLL